MEVRAELESFLSRFEAGVQEWPGESDLFEGEGGVDVLVVLETDGVA